MKTLAEKTAIYWGAFNPPTLAHAQVITQVIEETDISKIIFSPSWEREDKDLIIPQQSRKKLIEIFIEVLQTQGVDISLDLHFFEWRNEWITTTAWEEKYFREILWFSPYFIFWSDVASRMGWWSENKERFIEEKLRKIFITRPGYEFDFKANWFREYTLLDIPNMLDVSSSMAREMIARKRNIEDILFPEIVEEIEKQDLYQ